VKRIILYIMFFALLIAVLTACAMRTAERPRTSGHPALSEQEMLIACQDCHAQATPQTYRQWHQSGHGMATVKCYQCHGTFEGLRTEPSLDSCAVCHSGQWEHAEGQTCWQCHPAHTFEAGK
jgi:hypothetical protein